MFTGYVVGTCWGSLRALRGLRAWLIDGREKGTDIELDDGRWSGSGARTGVFGEGR